MALLWPFNSEGSPARTAPTKSWLVTLKGSAVHVAPARGRGRLGYSAGCTAGSNWFVIARPRGRTPRRSLEAAAVVIDSVATAAAGRKTTRGIGSADRDTQPLIDPGRQLGVYASLPRPQRRGKSTALSYKVAPSRPPNPPLEIPSQPFFE